MDKQKTEPEWHGPYLKEAERYILPRTKENVDKACQEAGLNDLPEKHEGEKEFYRKLIYGHWVCFFSGPTFGCHYESPGVSGALAICLQV